MKSRLKQMTDAACLEAVLRRETAERVVYMEYYPLPIAAIQEGKEIADAYTDPVFAYESQKKLANETGWIFQPVYPSLGGDFGGESKLPEGQYAQSRTVVRHAVENEAEAWKLRVPDLKIKPAARKDTDFAYLSAREKLANEVFNVTLCVSGPFTEAGEICGIERLCRWMVRKPEIVHHLLRIATDYLVQEAAAWRNTYKEANIIYFPSEPTASNNLISPAHFAEFAFPYIIELHRKVLALGYRHILCHICGNQAANLPYWAKVPMGDPGIVSVGPEIDIETAADFFPHDIIYGNLDPVILQTGTPDQVYKAAGKVVRHGKKLGRRYTFGQGCEIPPRASRENLLAMTRAVADYGWY
jgi:uroporphyrinogen decarboxylase